MGRGGSSRGRGKFKVTRGGGRQFSRDLDPRYSQQNNESSEEESSEEEEEEEEVATKLAPEMAALNLKLGNTVAIDENDEDNMTRAERKALKKKQADEAAKNKAVAEEDESESEDETLNPFNKKKAAEPTRREREAAEKKAAAERYAKLQAQGKTTQAKTDLARLQEIRKRREAAAAQRIAEQEEAAREAAAKKDRTVRK